MNEFQKIPNIDKILNDKNIIPFVKKLGKDQILQLTRNVVSDIRNNIKEGYLCPSYDTLIKDILTKIPQKNEFKRVINATGKVLHTNLGRAVLGESILTEITPIILGYSNLEYDLDKHKRGKRDDLLKNLICDLTGAEDAIVVNNNAASVMMILQCFAKDREVVVSRGELIEIGGSFRIPDIMEQSGAKMIEVGATNRTKVSDYEKAINNETSILFKAHQSNFFVSGFTEEVSEKQLADIGKKHNKITVYDIGSGLLKKPKTISLEAEPDVKSSIDAGLDLVCFSGDKLLGGPQAGIIIGKRKYIEKLKNHPLKRALRVGKLTTAALIAAIKNYYDDALLIKNNYTFKCLNQSRDDIQKKADTLKKAFAKIDLNSDLVNSVAVPGGGTLPNIKIESISVKISNIDLAKFDLDAETLYKKMHDCQTPIIPILIDGSCQLNCFSLDAKEMKIIVESVQEILNND